ncbi:4-diphosphocytidyl-2-C-methyl-D-erythritol kinase [Plasticicumulans lactativorans]|uniref:4-diphosphocytidyl-2-C-methyl-D-erythritol kinase n=1 Tax=Plasticicumulans lactativorans TaxID=1133106 RepID=A0A4R2L263_9GAMM|nr:4-(cytidine 5'-diphospho)-2-C-methyl-D-erythritol kinase [Plasticicumulans lactativorans]TCO81151.1 4-diphosphocytidyl-2-C-methyl-D-erythritol kinase [Plasticicumulans lactativorans]
MSGWSEDWPAPAKLNRFLHIVGRRADGYHRLQTLFQFIDRCDSLAFAVGDDGRIELETPLLGVAPQADLSVRAAQALREASGVTAGVRIRVVKRLPLGGGLGGGSSDAATTLVALNHLWGCGLDVDALAGLGLGLGADVPVFVRGCAAWAEGVGELLTPVEVDEPWFVVLVPGTAVATRSVFEDPELTRDSPLITIRDFLAGACRNDCEAVVYRRFPAVAEAAGWLGNYAPTRLTGTGACVFAAFASQDDARRVCAALPPGWEGFVARGRNRSPLLRRLAAAQR